VAETELCSGPWLEKVEDTYDHARNAGPNPAVVVAIEGARPGDCLAVHVHDVVPDEVGYTAVGPGGGALPDWLRRRAWGLVTKTVRIRQGFVEWDEGLRLAVSPMIGVLGTAPEEEVLKNSWPGPYGGNMDIQEVCSGATVYLPVNVDGALLHVGDMHAMMGDGEINGTGGIECRGRVTLSVELLPRPERMALPRILNDTHLITVGFARPAEDAFRLAVEQLVYWLADRYGWEEAQAFLFLGQVLEARVTQFVNPLYTYVAKVKRACLPAGDPMR
jgi:amidase